MTGCSPPTSVTGRCQCSAGPRSTAPSCSWSPTTARPTARGGRSTASRPAPEPRRAPRRCCGTATSRRCPTPSATSCGPSWPGCRCPARPGPSRRMQAARRGPDRRPPYRSRLAGRRRRAGPAQAPPAHRAAPPGRAARRRQRVDGRLRRCAAALRPCRGPPAAWPDRGLRARHPAVAADQGAAPPRPGRRDGGRHQRDARCRWRHPARVSCSRSSSTAGGNAGWRAARLSWCCPTGGSAATRHCSASRPRGCSGSRTGWCGPTLARRRLASPRPLAGWRPPCRYVDDFVEGHSLDALLRSSPTWSMATADRRVAAWLTAAARDHRRSRAGRRRRTATRAAQGAGPARRRAAGGAGGPHCHRRRLRPRPCRRWGRTPRRYRSRPSSVTTRRRVAEDWAEGWVRRCAPGSRPLTRSAARRSPWSSSTSRGSAPRHSADSRAAWADRCARGGGDVRRPAAQPSRPRPQHLVGRQQLPPGATSEPAGGCESIQSRSSKCRATGPEIRSTSTPHSISKHFRRRRETREHLHRPGRGRHRLAGAPRRRADRPVHARRHPDRPGRRYLHRQGQGQARTDQPDVRRHRDNHLSRRCGPRRGDRGGRQGDPR